MLSRLHFGWVLLGTVMGLGACVAAGPESEEGVQSVGEAQIGAPVSNQQESPLGFAPTSWYVQPSSNQGLVASGGGKSALAAPALSIAGATQTSIDVQVCASSTGAPAGFSLQWTTTASYAVYGWDSLNDPNCCAAGFSGAPGGSTFSLDPVECVVVSIGSLDPAEIGLSIDDGCNAGLTCGTEYVFRAFAHANAKWLKSPFSAMISGSTAPCDFGCTLSQGYWATHDGSPVANAWPVSSLSLGTTTYTEAQLSTVMDEPVGGDGLVSLAQQLVAAKLNIANGAGGSSINATIAAADALIGGLVVPPVGNGFLAPADTSALTATLTDYNEGTIGPGHCD